MLKNIEKLHAFGLEDESSSGVVFILRVVVILILLRWVCHGVSLATHANRENLVRRINFPLFEKVYYVCLIIIIIWPTKLPNAWLCAHLSLWFILLIGEA